jgi:hypothetical protein
MNKEAKHKEQTIRIGLPERHWVVLLAILDQAIEKSVRPGIEKLKKKGIKKPRSRMSRLVLWLAH